MAKKVSSIIKLQIPAGKATPAPPVGTALGPHGVNIQEVVQRFNAETQDRAGQIVPVEISIYEDRTFSMIYKTPPASDMLRKAAGVDKGGSEPQKMNGGKVTRAQIKEIAETKMPDLNTDDVAIAMKIVEGSARSMGIRVE